VPLKTKTKGNAFVCFFCFYLFVQEIIN